MSPTINFFNTKSSYVNLTYITTHNDYVYHFLLDFFENICVVSSMRTAIMANQTSNTQSPNYKIPVRTSFDLAKAFHLRSKGYSYKDIAKLLNKDVSTIFNALKPYEELFAIPQVHNVYEENRVDILNTLECRYLIELAQPEKIKEAKARDCAVIFGILADKRRLEEGKSTSNVAIYLQSQEKQQIIEELRQELANSGIDIEELEEIEEELLVE